MPTSRTLATEAAELQAKAAGKAAYLSDPEEVLLDLVGQVRAEPDLITQAVAASDLMKLMRESTSELSKIRRAALRALWGPWTLEEIADALEITRSRVEQIIKEE